MHCSISVVVGRFNRWGQLSRRAFACRCLNIYLDELRGGAFLRKNLVTDQSKITRIILQKNPLWGKDSLIPLMHHDPSDLDQSEICSKKSNLKRFWN